MTETLSRLSLETRRAADWARDFRRPSVYLNGLARATRNYFKRAVRKAKADFYNQVAREAMPEDIFRMRKWGKGVREYPSPPISRGADRPPAVNHEDKCDAIREELFQVPPDLPHIPEPNLATTHEDDLECPAVTWREIRDAIHKPSTKSAPGDDGMGYLVLRWAWAVREDEIALLVRKAVEWGYHPKRWRRAITVALRKPKKPDYSQPRAWRLIQLLVCLGKVVERIQAKRLAHWAVALNLVPAEQFGAMPSS